MEASGDGDLGAVALPGFIDILSSVITVFMFFMLISSAVMVFLSIQIKKQAEEAVKNAKEEVKKAKEDAAQSKQTSEQVQQLIGRLKSGQITVGDFAQMITDLNDKTGGVAMDTKPANAPGKSTAKSDSTATADAPADKLGEQALAKFSKSDEDSQDASVDAHSDDMLITFTPNSISVTDKTAKAINTYLDEFKKRTGTTPGKVVLEASDDPNAPSATLSREAELGRTLNVRNVLLDNKVSAEIITVHNKDATQESGTYNWVKIHVEK